MTDTSGTTKKTNKWLWPALAALVLVAILAWAFNRGADDGELSDRMASDPVSRQPAGVEMGQPNPPAQGVSTLVPDNADGNASVITEADAQRTNANPAGSAAASGAGSSGSATPAAGAAMPAPVRPAISAEDGRANPAPATPVQ